MRALGNPCSGSGRGARQACRTSMAAPSGTSRPSPVTFSGLKGVLFDIDGTLTNSDPLHFKVFQDMLVEADYNGGQPIEEHFFRSNISGRHNPEIAADLFPHWSEEQQTQWSEGKEQRFRDLAGSNLERLAGLTEFMRWIDSHKLRKGAVTNAPAANAHLMLKALDLDDYFEVLVLGEECERAKPFPDPYQEAMRKLGLEPDSTLVVEDSPSGAAVAAGIPVIALTTGQSEQVLKEAGAKAVCNDFTEIMQMIEEEGSRQ